MFSNVSGRKKYGKMICHMTCLYPKSSKLQSLSELVPFDLFPPKTQNFQHRVLSIYAFLNFTHHSASNELQQLYAVSNSLENSIKLWFDDVIITYMSKSPGIWGLNSFNMFIRTFRMCQTLLCSEWSRIWSKWSKYNDKISYKLTEYIKILPSGICAQI